jgi:hypothetical protein
MFSLKRRKIMKHLSRILIVLFVLAQAVFSPGMTAKPVSADPLYTCFPTCSTIDGRFLALAGTGLQTLAGDSIKIEIGVPSALTTFEVGIFDGDTGGNWDVGTTLPIQYTLYADPQANGTGTVQIAGAQWMGTSMPNNDWFTANITNQDEAKAPSGNYFYLLKVVNLDLTQKSENSFKVRSNGVVSLMPQAFAFVGALNNVSDYPIIYPNYPDLTTTRYDGNWDLYLDVPQSSPSFAIWDGDLDFGSYDCSANDTDDPDTSNTVKPSWTTGTTTAYEGVAVSSLKCANSANLTTSNPNDDSAALLYVRTPSVNYDVVLPDGTTTYHNDNPSGNMEWEQFAISSNAADVPALADYSHTGPLPAGTYQVRMNGMDLHNLNAWRFNYTALAVCENGYPIGDPRCTPIVLPYLVGDTVWYDANGNGVQDNGEAGLADVKVNLVSNGQILSTLQTGPTGQYTFEVEAGTYSVQIDPSNFVAGGPLAGYLSTTGGETQTNTVVNANILTYDFGYKGGMIGDMVWKDSNSNGIQDAGEPGVPNVTVQLLGSDGTTVLGTKTTNAAGIYSFTDLRGGTYYVNFTVPSGFITFTTKSAAGSTTANDSNVNPTTGKTDAIVLAAGATDNTIDAGLVAINLCGYIRTPGFWKNYSSHMSTATFLSFIQHTQDFSYLTVSQAVTILSKNSGTTYMGIPALNGVNATFLKFLLAAELNAVWNGQDSAPALGGQMGLGFYQGTGKTVNQLLHQAYLDRYHFTSTENSYVNYLGYGGEGAIACATVCLIKP